MKKSPKIRRTNDDLNMEVLASTHFGCAKHVLSFMETALPKLSPTDVLIKVFYAELNPGESEIGSLECLYKRLVFIEINTILCDNINPTFFN